MDPPPFDETRAKAIIGQMRAIPRILEQAKVNITETHAGNVALGAPRAGPS